MSCGWECSPASKRPRSLALGSSAAGGAVFPALRPRGLAGFAGFSTLVIGASPCGAGASRLAPDGSPSRFDFARGGAFLAPDGAGGGLVGGSTVALLFASRGSLSSSLGSGFISHLLTRPRAASGGTRVGRWYRDMLAVSRRRSNTAFRPVTQQHQRMRGHHQRRTVL